MKLEFSQQIFGKYSKFKFHRNPSGGRRVVSCGETDRRIEGLADGRTDMAKLIVAVCYFTTRLKITSDTSNLKLFIIIIIISYIAPK